MCPKTVLLVGFYGRGNFGDDLMCVALVRYILESTDLRIKISTANPTGFSNLVSERVELISRDVSSLFSALSEVDILCQGGGSIFHDAYSGYVAARYWINLLSWTALFAIAKLRGVTVTIAGAGIGPFRFLISRWITKAAFSFCDVISVRDAASLRAIQTLSFRVPVVHGMDLAFLLESDISGLRRTEREPERILGISTCALAPFSNNPGIDSEYWSRLGQALVKFSRDVNLKVVFYSLFVGEFVQSDAEIADSIVAQIRDQGVRCECISYDGNVAQFVTLMSNCDWFIATKFHAAVIAYLSGADLAVVPYHRKLVDFADEIGLPSERRVPIEPIQSVDNWMTLLRSFLGHGGQSTFFSAQEAATKTRLSLDTIMFKAGGK